jgi:hypothetical protein
MLNLKEYFKFDPNSTLAEKIIFFIILPFVALFAFGVFLWWLVIQIWKLVGSVVFRTNLFKKNS